ncbi:hypothetical protein H2199_001487 [Coniosporium tulheliwenetii]|uniref:Uncharacterized protein n=1 Tax=Coniosporium tulheliwenetii TaxID=3383036 RepID=A0ACC2ZM23_9PEZI|nr:hypothetical protein H2199_001487 [Cladosporium sp. JES 115]
MDEEGPRQFSDERKSAPRWDSISPRKTTLPGLDLKSHASALSESIVKSYHLSMIFSLANGFKEEAIDNAEPALANNLRNLRDHDIGIFSDATEFIGEGATFNVRRTVFPDSRDVVFKSRVFNAEKDQQKSLMEKLEAILLELRVLTHAPLRHHENIVQLIQVGWQGDALDRNLKWPVLVVEYADKGTLADFFENEQAVDFDTKVSICQNVAEGLRALHSSQIVHGDLKLLNVLVYSKDDGGYTAKLSDFGGALLDTPDSYLEPTGTPPWTAPEYHTERPREELLLSDVYALGLLFWCIMLHGADPFADKEIFKLPFDREKALDVILDLKRSKDFLILAKDSIKKYGRDLDVNLIATIFDNTLQPRPYDRSLSNVQSSIRRYLQRQDSTIIDESSATDVDSQEQIDDEESEGQEDAELRVITPTLAINHVLAAFEHTAEYDSEPDQRTGAASILARMYLGSDDFGIQQDIDKGLYFLLKSAESGYREDQGLMLRMHHAFGRDVPVQAKHHLGQWLLEAGATGSMTALEDMERFGYTTELAEAKEQLATRYCGYGWEVFEPFSLEGKTYISNELQMGRERGKDLRGYFLRLSAAYGCADAAIYLVEDLQTDVNDQNEVGDSALLFAARSGHASVLLTLLRLGADPRLGDRGNNTPLHWLCSFDDSDVEVVADKLIHHGADVNSQARPFPEHGRLEYAETDFVAGTPLHRAMCRNKLTAVRKLLTLGADLEAPALDDPEVYDLDFVSKRFDNDENYDLDRSMRRPPLFEAVLYGKSANALKLLELGANARAGEDDELPLSALYQCALASFEDLTVAEELCGRGLGIDDGPPDYETPFVCAVRNGCYTLADFLRRKGANVNALSTRGLLWSSKRLQTLLGLLVLNNGPSSISGIKFLLDDQPTSRVDLTVQPTLNYTVFHVLAMLDGDSQDGLTTSRALELCDVYFEADPAALNAQSLPHENNGDGSTEARGGNTALHHAVIHANFEVAAFLLMKRADTSIRNAMGMTPLDIAALAYPTFEKRFVPREVPTSAQRQLRTARLRREEIMRMLVEATPGGVSKETLERYTLDSDDDEG